MPPSKSWLRQPPPSDEERARREAIRARGYREQTFPERIRTTFPARAPGFGQSWKMTPEQIFRLNTVTAAPHNHRYERRVDAHKWVNARTGLPLEINLATVSLVPRTKTSDSRKYGSSMTMSKVLTEQSAKKSLLMYLDPPFKRALLLN